MAKNMQLTRRDFLFATAGLGSLALAACGGAPRSASSGAATSSASADAAASTSASAASDAQAGAAATASETGAQGASASASSASSKVLVAYFSRAGENYAGGSKEWLEVGNTKVMAGYIAEALGADQYEIVPAAAYPEGYDECCDVALAEQRENVRPAIAGTLPDVSAYDVVFIGCPIWWGDEPMIVRTFIEGVDLSGKTIVPFTTHGGSGLGRVPSNLQAALPSAKFLEAHAVEGSSVDGARDEVVAWATGLGVA